MLGVSVVKPLLPWVEVSVLRHWQEQLCHGRPSWIGVSPPWKMEYPEVCSITMRHIVRKVAAVEGRLVWFGSGFTAGTLFPDRWTCIWHYSKVYIFYKTNILLLYYMMSSVLEPSLSFSVSHDHVTILWHVWLSHMILYYTLHLSPK